MDTVITLAAENASLRLEMVVARDPSSTLDWWRVYLVSDKTVFLGAECLIIIQKRITDYLMSVDIETKDVYEHDGEKLIWITTLFETHTSLYGSVSSTNSDKKIFFQDLEACFIASVNLSKNNVENWIVKLTGDKL